MSWPTRYYVDFRFIVENAKDHSDAADQADALIKEATDNVWYTIDKVTKMQKDPTREHALWHIAAVKSGDPRTIKSKGERTP